jgi:hypothetical protein
MRFEMNYEKIRWWGTLVIYTVISPLSILFMGIMAVYGGFKKHLKDYPSPNLPQFIPISSEQNEAFKDFHFKSKMEPEYEGVDIDPEDEEAP